MKCTFKSIKPDGEVAHRCDRVAITCVQPSLVDACNDYWASTASTYRWSIDPVGVCGIHADNIKELNEMLKEGDFDSEFAGVNISRVVVDEPFETNPVALLLEEKTLVAPKEKGPNA